MSRKYRSLYDVQEIVFDLLSNNPKTRSSDRLLYLEVLKQVGIDPRIVSVSAVMLDDDVPIYPSISRARRKLQAKHPEFKADANVEAARELEEERFKNYATDRMD